MHDRYFPAIDIVQKHAGSNCELYHTMVSMCRLCSYLCLNMVQPWFLVIRYYSILKYMLLINKYELCQLYKYTLNVSLVS